MVSRIQKIFRSPVFDDDADKTRMGNVMHQLLLYTMGFLVVLEISLAPFPFPERTFFLITLPILMVVIGIDYWIMQRGHVRLASIIFIVILWVTFSVFLPFAGGTRSVMAVFYVAGAAIFTILFGKRAAVIHIVACGIVGLAIILLQASPYALPLIFPIHPLIGWVTIILSLVLTVGALNMVLGWREAALATLREKTEELDRYFTLSLDLLCIADTDGRFIRLNPEWEKALGYPLAELEGRQFLDFVHPDDLQSTLDTIAQLDQQREVLNFENRYRCKDGSYRWIEWRSSPKGKLIYAAAREVTTRKQAEQALAESEALYRRAIEVIGAVPYYLEYASKTYRFIGEGIHQLTGYRAEEMTPELWESLIQKSIVLDKASGMERVAAMRLSRRGQLDIWKSDDYIRTRDGQMRWVMDAAVEIPDGGRSHSSLGILVDITERKQTEEALRDMNQRLEETLAELRETQKQMMHQERLAAVGQLAAGIAHDFNNILASIVLYTQMSLRSELPPQIRQRLEVIAQQTNRAADLVQQILDFGRRAVLERQPLMLDSFLKEVVKLLQRTLPENVQIDLTIDPGDHLILADPTRIQQVVVNLALNARDAMPNGGELHISLARISERQINCVDCGPVFGGEWVEIAVKDTGSGIPPEALPHIFEPFFTTRAPLGHGLGLAQVYGLVNQHNGHIAVETHVGQGTTFRLYWPALQTTPLQPPSPPSSEIAQGQGQTILVVEDDVIVRATLTDALDVLGYRVLEAANGEEALTLYTAHAGDIALVLSDWVMPAMGGLELVHTLQERAPALKALMLTGHPLSQETRETVPPNVVGWTLKPPDLEQLARDLSQALDREENNT